MPKQTPPAIDWGDDALERAQSFAANLLAQEGEPGSPSDIVRRSEIDAVLRARLEGAAMATRASFDAAVAGCRGLCASSSSDDYESGASHAAARLRAAFNPEEEYAPLHPPPAVEVAVEATPREAAGAVAFVRGASPRPGPVAAASVAAVVELLSGIAATPGDRASGLEFTLRAGWAPAASAATFVEIALRAAPGDGHGQSESDCARRVAARLVRAMSFRDEAPAGPPVSFSLTGGQLVTVHRSLLAAEPAVRPWAIRDSFVAAWGDMVRPASCPRRGPELSAREPHGGTLTMPLSVARWLCAQLRGVSGKRWSSARSAERRIMDAVGRSGSAPA